MELTKLKLATRSIIGMTALASLALVQAPAVGDDTEIYSTTVAASGNARPKVLLLLDTSGSMNIEAVAAEDTLPPYDPNATYQDAGFDEDRIYWTEDNTTDKPGSGTNNYFEAAKNRCATSYDPLNDYGNFTSKMRRFAYNNNGNGNKVKWRGLNGSDHSPIHVDCKDDPDNSNAGNGAGVADGYPDDPSNPKALPAIAYTATYTNDVSWGSSRRFYTGHYLNYWNDDSLLQEEQSRLEVAQQVLNELVNVNTSIDFGLAVFNNNSHGAPVAFYVCGGSFCLINGTEDDHGGRIISALPGEEGMTDAEREDLAGPSGLINSLTATGSTPLCESTYEVYRYLSGDTPRYGLKRDVLPQNLNAGHDAAIDLPAEDSDAFDGGSYVRPTTDCKYTYVILMTDGFPSRDDDANTTIEALDGVGTCESWASDGGGTEKNCLPELAGYMATNDLDNDPNNGEQLAITYTIGFATDQLMLQKAAENGGGKYYTANDTTELSNAFQDAILEILSDETSFTSPSVAVNTFTRRESRNEVFFAMFKPDSTKDWRGNVKRLDINVEEVNDVIVKTFIDAGGDPAIDPDTDFIKADARTLWRTEAKGADGPVVDQGGVGELLAESDLTARQNDMYTNTGTNGALETFEEASFTPEAYGFDTLYPGGPEEALWDFWGVADGDEFTDAIQWGIGYDTEGATTTNNREWIMGDVLHSRPRVLSYGLRNGENTPIDLRILVGTNSGFLHMFSNDDGKEDWAFFPKELAHLLTSRRLNSADIDRPYGVDGPAVIHTYDRNSDGTLDHIDGDKAWVFFGLRRGGRYIYGLDISNPDDPSSLWFIGPDTPGFSELGQTWSVPVVTYIPGHVDGSDVPKPVLVFGAGYDTAKDGRATLGNDGDTIGRGVFIVDAETGSLLWSVTPAADSPTNMQATELENSVPAAITTLDSNADGLTDRLYFGDTAGVLWRLDMSGSTLPDSAQDDWRLHKLFTAVPEGVTRTQENDRRFYGQPELVRIERNGKPVDALLVGTGDRTNPAALDNINENGVDAVENAFYMIADREILPRNVDFDDSECNSPTPALGSLLEFLCKLPLDPDDLYDATSNALEALKLLAVDDTDRVEEYDLLYKKDGWQVRFVDEGEKSLSKSITLNARVFFGSFIPGATDEEDDPDICGPEPGQGRLYGVSIYDATRIPNFDTRYREIGSQIPDTPAVHVTTDGSISIIPPQGSGGTDDGNLIATGSELIPPFGSYWYRKEY